MSAPRSTLPVQGAPAQPTIQRGESFANLETKAETGKPAETKQKRDAFTQGGQSAAARAIVQTGRARAVEVAVPAGLSPLLDVTMRLAASAHATRQIDDAKANEVAAMLDRATVGFDVRLAHAVLERACVHALISSRSRQRLSSSLNAALGRTGERLGADRPQNVDSLGIIRGETGFADLLLEATKDRKR